MEDAFTWLGINSTYDDRAVILTPEHSDQLLEHNKIKEPWVPVVETIQGHAGVSYIETWEPGYDPI
jgi:hypothetical protein